MPFEIDVLVEEFATREQADEFAEAITKLAHSMGFYAHAEVLEFKSKSTESDDEESDDLYTDDSDYATEFWSDYEND